MLMTCYSCVQMFRFVFIYKLANDSAVHYKLEGMTYEVTKEFPQLWCLRLLQTVIVLIYNVM